MQNYVPGWHNWQVDVKLKIGDLYYVPCRLYLAFSVQSEQSDRWVKLLL